jgi:hypothetical protein
MLWPEEQRALEEELTCERNLATRRMVVPNTNTREGMALCFGFKYVMCVYGIGVRGFK